MNVSTVQYQDTVVLYCAGWARAGLIYRIVCTEWDTDSVEWHWNEEQYGRLTIVKDEGNERDKSCRITKRHIFACRMLIGCRLSLYVIHEFKFSAWLHSNWIRSMVAGHLHRMHIYTRSTSLFHKFQFSTGTVVAFSVIILARRHSWSYITTRLCNVCSRLRIVKRKRASEEFFSNNHYNRCVRTSVSCAIPTKITSCHYRHSVQLKEEL